uniref:G_PROTEIN_RECEP_F1_2 domain-containing protein n=1 Tax=Strongyloides stercoralis TaxID=6248 RepID=A0A0K0EMK9_STRER
MNLLNNTTYCEPLSKNSAELIVDGPLTLLCVILGVIGNVQAILFLQSCKLNRRLVANMIVLFFWDCLLLIVAVLYYSLTSFFELFQIPIQMDKFIVIFHGPASITLTSSIWLTLLIVIYRYLAVIKPFNGIDGSIYTIINNSSSFTQKIKFYKIPLFVVGLAILINIPIFFEMSYQDCYDKKTLSWSKNANPTPLRINPMYKTFYRLILKTTLESFIPFILAATLLALTQITVMRSNQRRMQLAPGSQRDHNEKAASYMAVIIVFKFLILHFLRVSLDVWEVFIDPTDIFDFLAKLSNVLVTINSATNYLVYLGKRSQKSRKNTGVRGKQLTLKVKNNDECHILMVKKNSKNLTTNK